MAEETAAEMEAILDDALGVDSGEGENRPLQEQLDQEEGEQLVEDVFGGGQRLERLGDAVLVASEDGLSASFRGALPEGTTYEKVVEVLENAGIVHGIIPSRIHDALPRKQSRRRETRRRSRAPSPGKSEVVVAEGRPPVSPKEARVQYRFDAAPEEDVKEVKAVLEGFDFGKLKRCAVSLPFVQPGQVLAEVVQGSGEPGMDIFGVEIPPELPPGAELKAGENVSLADDGQSCAATAWGYAGLLDGAVAVLSPLFLSRDLMRVFFVWLPQAGDRLPQADEQPVPALADVKALLEQNGIVHGVDEQAIAALCEKLQKKERVERATQIARGTEAAPGKDVEWQFVCDPEQTKYYGEILRVFGRSRRVDFLEDYCKGLAGKPVSAGERLATRQAAVSGTAGKDVFGEEFLPDGPRAVELEGGESIRFSEDGDACFAEIYGYIGIDKSRVQIVSPIWVAPDRMTAYFINLPQLGGKRAPVPEEIDRLLELASVRYGIDHKGIGVLCEMMKQGLPVDLAVPIARGREARPGEDGTFEFSIDTERKPGMFREDGSIDFKQLNLTPLIEKGQPIGSKVPSTEGVAGTDIAGNEIPAPDGRDIAVEVGKNVRLARASGQPDRYIAEIDGELTVVDRGERISLAVHRTMTVEGDIDYHTGNIDYPGNVEVEGSVKSSFAVKAEGSVVIGNAVEDNASVVAGGNVAVQYGITGEKARVVAGGSVFARFINAARVWARNELVVSEYIFNASVKADDSVSVLGTESNRSSGIIVGGSALAGRQITAKGIGVPPRSVTHLTAGVDFSLLKQVTELQELIDRYQKASGQILRLLGLESPEPMLLRKLLLGAKGPLRKKLAESVKKLMELLGRRQAAVEEKGDLERRLEGLALKAAIDVSGPVTPGTGLRIGSQTMAIGEETADIIGVRFFLIRKDGELELKMGAS